MSQVFVAKYLNQLLQYWEDCNLSGEFNFQLALKTGGINDSKADLGALTGSELNRLGLFARSIPDYQNLRKVLAGHPYTHQTNFLPRIPKDMRGIFGGNYDLFLDHDFTKSPVRIPSYLLKWNETKRACIIDDSIPLPVVDLRKENWLNKLPYHSLFLKLDSPFVFEQFDPHEEWSINSFLIFEDRNYVRIMAWPEEIERFLLTHEERMSIQEGIVALKRNKVPKTSAIQNATKVNDWFLSDLAVLCGTSEIRSVQGVEATVRHADIYNPDLWTDAGQKTHDFYGRLRIMLETINGFCKLMATLPPKKTVKTLGQGSSVDHAVAARQWFELPMQTVEYFHTDKDDGGIVIKRGLGSEKSPHKRRRHIRRMVKKDGSIVEKWIEEITVRPDKLETVQLQGGALKVQ